jgi:hypothetical protein
VIPNTAVAGAGAALVIAITAGAGASKTWHAKCTAIQILQHSYIGRT